MTAGPSQSKLEVEQKFRVDSHSEVEQQLVEMNARLIEREVHRDTYLRHPCRDFRATDEALRIRLINQQIVITYKGPRVLGPVKTRPEIELPLVAGTEDQWFEIWTMLGFEAIAEVEKRRSVYQLDWQNVPSIVALDSVSDLGLYVEVELVIERNADVNQAQSHIQSLAQHLGLTHLERRSYLGMLLALKNRA